MDYRELYESLNYELKEIVKSNDNIATEFQLKSISTENFAKKLLGQIVFLYFIQKKGWLGNKIELNITEKGNSEINKRVHELQDKWANMKNAYESGDKQKLQQVMKDEKSFLPTMMYFGIIDIMMFSMMFSMMGMAMSNYIPADDMSQFDDGATGDGLGDSGMDDGGFDFDIGF